MEEFRLIVMIVVGALLCMLLGFVAVVGMTMLCEIPERAMFNEKFETNYGAIQWCFAETTIKDYIHQGEQKKFNVNIIK